MARKSWIPGPDQRDADAEKSAYIEVSVHQVVALEKSCRITDRKWLSERVLSIWIEAPGIARACRPGQFVVVRAEKDGAQIPLSIAEVDKERTQIRLIVLSAGYSMRLLNAARSADRLADVAGPVGTPATIQKCQRPVLGVAEEAGAAFLLPYLVAHREAGNRISVILGASTLKELLLVDEIQKIAHDLHLCTDDGIFVRKGPVADVLIDLLNRGLKPELIIAVGPPAVMRATSEIAARRGIPVSVNINPVLVDGSGTCAGCRILVGERECYACTDGPDFDGAKVQWDDLMARVDKLQPQDVFAWDQACKIISSAR